MRGHTLKDGTVIDLDVVSLVTPIDHSKVHEKHSGYEIKFIGGESLSLIDVDDSREALLAEWQSIYS